MLHCASHFAPKRRALKCRTDRKCFEFRRWFTLVEHKTFEDGRPTEPPLRKVAAVAVIENPYAGRYVDNLDEMIGASRASWR